MSFYQKWGVAINQKFFKFRKVKKIDELFLKNSASIL